MTIENSDNEPEIPDTKKGKNPELIKEREVAALQNLFLHRQAQHIAVVQPTISPALVDQKDQRSVAEQSLYTDPQLVVSAAAEGIGEIGESIITSSPSEPVPVEKNKDSSFDLLGLPTESEPKSEKPPVFLSNFSRKKNEDE